MGHTVCARPAGTAALGRATATGRVAQNQPATPFVPTYPPGAANQPSFLGQSKPGTAMSREKTPMKTRLLAAMLLLVPAWAAARAQDPAPRWLADFDEARRLAEETGRPLLVVFR